MGRRRVVVTGLGIVCPLGLGLAETWSNLLSGKSGIGPITQFDAATFPTRIAGEVRGFDPSRWMDSREVRRNDRFIHFAVAASEMALADAGVDMKQEQAERVGCVIGTGIGGIATIADTCEVFRAKGVKRINPFFIPSSIVNLAPGQVSIKFGLKGPNLAPVSACATGNHSIGEGLMLIERGMADVVLAGGAEASICGLTLGGFCAARAMSERNDSPQTASRPFDRGRDGFVASEGAGVVVLEEFERARARGARIYAELAGYGATADAYHVTTPAPDGEGGKRAMQMALRDAGLSPDQVGYVNTHGTSTPVGDAIECKAIAEVFGGATGQLWVSSTKSMTGHMLGAAGGVEAVFSVMALHTGIIPPTINVEDQDPECALDVVPGAARERRVGACLSNSFGFGGTNAVLAFRRV